MSDNGILHGNLSVLERRWPELARNLEKPHYAPDWILTTAKNGLPSIIVKTDNGELPLHSQYEPFRDAMRWVKSLEDDWERMILFGMGLGYHLKALQEVYPGRKVVLVENNPGHFYQALKNIDLTSVLNWLDDILISDDERTAGTWLGRYIIENAAERGLLIKALPAYERIYQSYWQSLQKTISETIMGFRANVATTAHFRFQWLTNLRKNLLTYLEAPNLGQLFARFSGVPVIVVAAGPSLENNVHLLPELKGKAIILAAGSAIGPLLHHGVVPDLVLSVDPGDANYKHFEHVKEKDLPLAFASTLNHHIVKNYQGPLISFSLDAYQSLDNTFERLVEREKGRLPSGGTVAVPTFYLAHRLGGNPIILLGQDLAYVNGKSHAAGNVFRREISKNDLLQVEGIDGSLVTTNQKFKVMKAQMEQTIARVLDNKLVIDATEGGAKIAGTEIMTLAEVRDKFCQRTYPVTEIINEALTQKKPLTVQEKQKLRNKVEKLLKDAERVLKEDNAFQEEIEKLSARLARGELRPQDLSKRYKQIKKSHHRIQRTELYKDYIQLMFKEQLDIKMMVMASKIDKEENFEEQARIVVNGYKGMFAQLKSCTEFLEQDIFKPLLEELTGEKA